VRDLLPLINFIRDHVLLTAGFCGIGLMFLFFALIEAFKTNKRGDEILRLRQRLYELERDASSPQFRSPDPVVLSRRWAHSGSALTSTDGGCFLIVDRVAAAQRSAQFTVRVDGLPVFQGHAIRCGETLELPGRSGTYKLQLWAVDGVQVAVSVSLRMSLGNLAIKTGD
jgi:hypothetical protein